MTSDQADVVPNRPNKLATLASVARYYWVRSFMARQGLYHHLQPSPTRYRRRRRLVKRAIPAAAIRSMGTRELLPAADHQLQSPSPQAGHHPVKKPPVGIPLPSTSQRSTAIARPTTSTVAMGYINGPPVWKNPL